LVTTIVPGEERRIAKSGGTAVLYVPKEYFAPGDTVRVEVTIVDNQIRLTVEKKLYNFDRGDIRSLAKQYDFTTEYDKELADMLVFNAIRRDGLSLSYTQSRREAIALGYVALSRKLQDLTPEAYIHANSLAKDLKGFDVLVRTEGDLDTINMLKEPERYKLKQDEAIQLIRKSGKKVGLSLVARFDNRKNKLDEVRSAIDQLTKLETKLTA
jgi:hypothetical protein